MATPSDADRLARIERELRAWRLAGLAAVAVGVFVAARPPTPEVVRAERFELVDARGRTRGAWLVRGGTLEGPFFQMGDPDSTAITLYATPGLGAYVSLNGQNLQSGRTGNATLSVDTDGASYSAGLRLNEDRQPSAHLSSGPRRGQLTLFDHDVGPPHSARPTVTLPED